MAWKLRKDKLQAETPLEDGNAVETATIPVEATQEPMALHGHDEDRPLPSVEAEVPEQRPFLLPESEPDGAAPEEPQFTPFDFSAPAFQADDAEPPAFHTTGETSFAMPIGTDEPEADLHPFEASPALNPFAPYQPQESHPAETPLNLANPFVMPPPADPMAPEPETSAPTSFVREAIAPSLVTQATENGIPRVAPFIVDVPPVEEAPAITGTLVLHMGKLSASFPITKDQIVIGRPDGAVQSYPDVEIELDDAVSRRHAEIRRHDGGYYLVDTMSTNGTRLNGEKLEVYQEYALAHGDRIRLGDRTEIVFE